MYYLYNVLQECFSLIPRNPFVETLKRCKPIICIEDFEPWKERYNTSLTEIEVILFDIGYSRIGQVDGDTDKIYKIL
jgi:hypothetical protein